MMMPIIANRVSKLGVTDIKLNLTSILRMKTMIDFYYCNVVKVEIKRFQFKLVCVEFNRIGLLASLIRTICAPRISEPETKLFYCVMLVGNG